MTMFNIKSFLPKVYSFVERLSLQKTKESILEEVDSLFLQLPIDWYIVFYFENPAHHLYPMHIFHENLDLKNIIKNWFNSNVYHIEHLGHLELLRNLKSQWYWDFDTKDIAELKKTEAKEKKDLLEYAYKNLNNNYISILNPSHYSIIPLLNYGVVWGALEIGFKKGIKERIRTELKEVIEMFSNILSLALLNIDLQKELQQISKAKDDWFSVVSHELKTPLTPLKISLQLMERSIIKGKNIIIQDVHNALLQVNHISTLVNTLLDISKIELGPLDIFLEKLNISEYLEEILGNIKKSHPYHKIESYILLKNAVVFADKDRISQIIINIVDNALKFSSQDKSVIVTLKQDEEHPKHVLIIIEDFGIGIPAKEQIKLFQKYFRASNAPEKWYAGLGLGLWVSYELVQRHHGMLWAESTEGKGSRFYCSLPVI